MKSLRFLLLGAAAVLALSTSCDKDNGAAAADSAGSGASESPESGTPSAGVAGQPDNGLPKATDLLAKTVEASGGLEATGKIETFHIVGEISAPKLKITGQVETWWKGGDFYMVQHAPGIGTNRSGKKGDVVWMDETVNGLRKLDGLEAEQHLWASSLLLAATWQDHFETAATVGEREVDGNKVYDVKLVSASGAEMTLGIDAKTFLVADQTFDVVNPMGKTPVTMKSLDYTEVEGVKIAFRQVTDLQLVELTQTLTKVEFNVPVDETKFAMPDGGLEVVTPVAAPPQTGLAKVAPTAPTGAGEAKEVAPNAKPKGKVPAEPKPTGTPVEKKKAG